MNDEWFKLIEMKVIKINPNYIVLLINKCQSRGMNPIKAFFIGIMTNLKLMFNITDYSSIIYIFKNN